MNMYEIGTHLTEVKLTELVKFTKENTSSPKFEITTRDGKHFDIKWEMTHSEYVEITARWKRFLKSKQITTYEIQ